MAVENPPFVAWRQGRPRFVPGARERALGFKGQDLRHGPDGPWFSYEEAAAWAASRLAEIAAARRGARPAGPAAAPGRTVEDLLRDWHRSGDVQGLKPATIEDYRAKIDALIVRPGQERTPPEHRRREPFALAVVEAIGKPEVKAFFVHLRKARGWTMALGCIAAFRAAWSWGETSTRWRLPPNPALRLKLPRPPGRIVVYTPAEIAALVAAADAMPCRQARTGQPVTRQSIGHAIYLGLFTGQRQTDRLLLTDAGRDDAGRRQLRQSKTKTVVAVPETPQLAARLAMAAAGVAALRLELGTRPDTLIVDETTGRPYNRHTYHHVFAEVRAAAARTCPSLAGKQERDLRDTAVTWLARAGCTPPEIAAITGHAMGSIHQIMRHYLAISPDMADSAIAKMVEWMDKQGMQL